MQIDDLLITESQLNSRLNNSVHENRRGEFSLLLAMLSHDALDFSQFHLPKTEIDNLVIEEEVLRKQFGAGPKQLLASDEYNMLVGQFNAALISQEGERSGMTSIKLIQCLNPEPLAIRNDDKHIPLHIIDNCELAVRRRIKSEQTQLANPPIDAAAFYDSLNNDAIHQPLQLIAV
ncbi:MULTISPECIES: VC2046/SO_2500 family protein [unclassified Pseudoalteromonas]|uniref:VC2046/SO_2500 family protein n=1 Tax=unclassified Pseudoalteromonas TaxID=194690 RepID=UPI00140C52DD|nr:MULTISPECIES: VC2046/SO_2500 family protein [unclassified Pseudoalteromonas]MBH0040334.1 queD like 2 [Pseudoalteromonas sp. SWN166]